MWVTTQIGSAVFAALLAVGAYALGKRQLAIELALGTLTLWLFVELIKAFTDRARPFNLLRETRVIGWREPGLSFPSGHTAQTLFIVALCISHFQLSLGIAAVVVWHCRAGRVYPDLRRRTLSARCDCRRDPGNGLGNFERIGSAIFLSGVSLGEEDLK